MRWGRTTLDIGSHINAMGLPEPRVLLPDRQPDRTHY